MSLLHKRVLNVGLVGPGLVGKSFLDQISNSPQLEVIAIINSTKMGLSSSGKLDMDANMDDFITFCQENAPCVIVDCTSSQSIANSYPAWLKKNLSIITPNKKAFSSSIELFTEIMNLTSEKWPRIYHESSVG